MKKEIGKEIHYVSNCIKRDIDKKVVEYGLTSVQSRVLFFILKKTKEGNRVYQKDIEECFDIRRSSVTSILQLLEKNGYITRESVETDARLKQLKLTEKGSSTVASVHKIILLEEQKMTKALTEDEIQIFFKVLEKISKSLNES